MRRFLVPLLAMSFAAALPAQPWPTDPSEGPSVTDPSVPLSYVGGDGSISLGINAEGETEGQLLGVFARNDARAVVGQLWWDRAGAGGLQTDFNWLWGMDPEQARLHPDQATIARLTFALDQNAAHDRKATVGFGIERRAFSVEGYLARGFSGGRAAGGMLLTDDTVLTGSDDVGDYAQVETTATELLFESRPYGIEVGLQASHVFEPLALRLRGGASTQDGDGARANTFSLGFDTPLGTRGWGLSAQAEQVRRHGSIDGDDDDLRLSAWLRYEFGRNGAFVPTASLQGPAWIPRAIARPSSSHPRTVESYRRVRDRVVTVSQGPREYTNRYPLPQPDSASTAMGQAVAIDVLANDADPDGDALSISAVGTPAHGSVRIEGGMLSYLPEAGHAGQDAFSYTVVDGRGGSASAMVTISIAQAPNRPPLARDDNASTLPGQAVSIDVLANDADPDGDTLALLSLTQPMHGTATFAGSVVIYRPAPGHVGSDRFEYTVDDGHGGRASASVTIVVDPLPNRAPFARDDAASTAAGMAVAIAVLANDVDPDGDPLAVVAVTQPAGGSVAFTAGGVTYTPAAGFAGSDRFGYTISDGRGGSASASVDVIVTAAANTPPVALDDAVTAALGGPTAIDVLANDSDADGDPLSISAVTPPTGGSVVISGTGLIYTANAAFTGVDRFTYTIVDGRGGSATANVSVTMPTLPNQPPVAVDDAGNTTVGTAIALDVLDNDSDPDGDAITIVGTTQPANGLVAFTGTTVTYAPAAGFVGTDSFTYTIDDGRGGSASATVRVTVGAAPNQPPVATPDVAVTPVNSPVVVDVLANDSDPDGDPLTIIAVTQPANGTVAISGSTLIYTPNPGFFGIIDTFTYTIDDGRGGTATTDAGVFVTG